VKKQTLILIVEDNEANQLLASSVLEREGYRVELAANAREAVDRMTTNKPDLILMDIQLPGEDGLGLTRRLKTDPKTAMIPIVALTAHAMVGDREDALAAGCVGYIAKPINTRTFGEQIRQYIIQGVPT
jgi:two-component system, cell cycle response regulator DivK